jgi:hypothetical protein
MVTLRAILICTMVSYACVAGMLTHVASVHACICPPALHEWFLQALRHLQCSLSQHSKWHALCWFGAPC